MNYQYAIRCTLYAIFLHAVRCTLNAVFFHAIRNTRQLPSALCLPPPVRRRYLRAYKAPSTTVESPLQISYLFMQNEPNFQKVKMNINKVLSREYENKTLGERGKNEPKTNPNEANSNPIKANLKPKRTQNEPNRTQFQRNKMLPRWTINVFWLYLVSIICVNLWQEIRAICAIRG